ncbi:MAG TPA: penicillin-insensitive murein endopeptidase [Polyangiales bacterium]
MKGWSLALLIGLGCSVPSREPVHASPAKPKAVEVDVPVTVAETTTATPAPPTQPAPLTLDALLASLPPASVSTSIGSPTNGRLEGGVPLPLAGPGFRHNDRRSRDARYGTVEVIRAIARAADRVAREAPGSELVVNDLGLPQGGRISHHGSHRAGRDADILFFLRDDAGNTRPAVGEAIEPDGTGYDYKDLATAEDDVRVHFDAARTWRFVRALLEDPEAVVQRIFVVEHVRTMLLAEAERVHAPRALVQRFSEVSCQPGYPHDDHLHVRWYCSLEDLGHGCEDLAPQYPWRSAELSAAHVKPVLAQRVKSEQPAEVVTQAEAEAAVLKQSPHPEVLAFLERRKAWEKQPHPGRPYCK